MNKKNVACRIFKDQLDLINQLPENERAAVLYAAVNESFNQFENQFENQIENQNDNQNENQFDCALMSVSVSVSSYIYNNLTAISKCVLELLTKNIVWREFSINYGGRRLNSGRKKEIEQPKPEKPTAASTPSTAYSAEFLRFWDIYPRQRRGSKDKAFRAYQKAIKRGHTDSDILSKTQAYCVSDEVARGYAKGCEAWLNSDGFLNDYTIKPGQKPVSNTEKTDWSQYDIKVKRA